MKQNGKGMPKIKELYPLCGSFVNLEYTIPGGQRVKFLLVCEYGESGSDPEIVVYTRQ